MKVLVTGATGFIGKHLVRRLICDGHEVNCLVRETSDISGVGDVNIFVFDGDLTPAFGGVEAVYHLIGGGPVSGCYEKLKSLNLDPLQTISKYIDGQKFIYFSSVSAMGLIADYPANEDSTGIAISGHEKVKLACEAYCRGQIKTDCLLVLRPTLVYGPGDIRGEILRMCRIIKGGNFPIIGSGSNAIPLVFIDDVIRSAVRCLEVDKSGTFILAGLAISMNELVKIIADELGVGSWGFHLPVSIVRGGTFLIEASAKIFHQDPLFTQHRIDTITSNRFFSTHKARAELGFHPDETGLTIRETVKWYKEHGYV